MKNSILICLSILINAYGHSQSVEKPSIETLTTTSVIVRGKVNLQNTSPSQIKNWGVIQGDSESNVINSVVDVGIDKKSLFPGNINETIGQHAPPLNPYIDYYFKTYIVTRQDKVFYSEIIKHEKTLTSKTLFDKIIIGTTYHTIYGHTNVNMRNVDFSTRITNNLTNDEKKDNFKLNSFNYKVSLELRKKEDNWITLDNTTKINKTDIVINMAISKKDIDDKNTKYRFKVTMEFKCLHCKDKEFIEKFSPIGGITLEEKEDIKFGQWPIVSHTRTQGIITGTIGEFRKGGRFHNGTDIASDVGDKLRSVYSIKDDKIKNIKFQDGDYYANFVEMESGIQYLHTEVVDTKKFKPGSIVLKGEKFGIMSEYYDGVWGIHVHIQKKVDTNTPLDNFLISGFNSFNDNIKFDYPGNMVKFNNNRTFFFPSSVRDLNLSNNPPYKWVKELDGPILHGKIQIVSNIFQTQINTGGAYEEYGKIAPFSMGYVVKDTFNRILLNKSENITFNKQFIDPFLSFKKIHVPASTEKDPLFIISNKIKDGMITDDYFETDKLNDGKVFLILTANGGPDPNKGSVSDSIIPIYLDNYKTYIQKIEIKDANNFTRYVAEWSKLINPGDGSVFLVSKNSDPFNKGTKTRMIVYVSEKIPSLNLTMTSPSTTNKPLVTDFVNTDNGLGKKWEKDVVLPNDIPGPTDLSLSFKVISKNLLYGFQENVDNADVKRDTINGNFNDNGSGVDKFHKIKMCPENKDFKITVKPDDEYQNITVSAQGGLPPYAYHIQDMSQPLTGRIAFSSKNVFPVEQAKNYLIRVRDNNACQAEEYYTIERIECDAVTISGGSGITPNNINLGNRSGKITVNWDFYGVPDRMVINYRGIRIFDSKPVSYTGSYSFDHKVEKGSSNIATITIFGPSGTAWNYVVTCPKSTPQTTPLSPNFEENEIDLASKIKIYPNSGKLMFETNNQIPNNEAYFFYRELGELNWNAAGLITFPYEFNHGSKEFEFKFEKVKMSNSDENEKLIIIPNPSTGPVNIHFTSDIIGEVNWSVYDILGKELVNRKEHTQKGLNIFNWNPENARFGVFLVKVQQEGKIFTKKMLFQPK